MTHNLDSQLFVAGVDFTPTNLDANGTISDDVFYVVATAGVTTLALPTTGSVLFKNISGGSVNLTSADTFDGNAGPLIVANNASYLLIHNPTLNDWSINAGGNVPAGTVEDSMLRWNDVTKEWEEDPLTLLNDENENFEPFIPVTLFRKDIVQKVTGIFNAFLTRFIMRFNDAGQPDPNGIPFIAGAGIGVHSHRLAVPTPLSSQATMTALLDDATQYAQVQLRLVKNTSPTTADASAINFSRNSGVQYEEIGYQPSYRYYEAANDTFQVTTTDMVVVAGTGSYPTTADLDIQLPATPLDKQQIMIINNGEGVVFINGNGKDIMYPNYVHYLSTHNSSVILQYDGGVWHLVNGTLNQTFSAKYLDGTNLGETKTACFTPAKGYLRSARINILDDSNDGVKCFIRIVAGGGEIVAPFQIADGVRVTIDTYLVQAQDIVVEVTTASTSTTETFAVTFDFEPL